MSISVAVPISLNPTPTMNQIAFRAMNTDIGIWTWGRADEAHVCLAQIRRTFHRVERALSRFRSDSELSRLNARAGEGAQAVSPLLLRVLAAALDAARATGGLFDPTLLHPLREAGYDRSFERIGSIATCGPQPVVRRETCLGWEDIGLDRAAGTVTVPAGVGLDLGGIAKGWTVDHTLGQLAKWGPALVDAGGDLRTAGAPRGQRWPIAVQHPFDPQQHLCTLALADLAVATSTVGRRCWMRDGRTLHHLIDPRTQTSCASDLHSVTVIGATTVESEVAAKVALILGGLADQRFLNDRGLSALLVGRDGVCRLVGRFADFVSEWHLRPSAQLLDFSGEV